MWRSPKHESEYHQMRNDAIVFDPHPDDADWWTGGLTILLKEIGWNVTYVCVGPTTKIARANAIKSAKLLGVKREFLEIPINGNDHFARDLRKKVPAIIKKMNGKMIFIPPFCDYHREHVLLARELFSLFHWSAGLGLGFIEVYSYDSHENRQPIEIYIDISRAWERHRQSLAMHTNFERPSLPENTLIRVKQGRAQSLGASIPAAPVEYAEGYRLLQADVKCISSLSKLLPKQFYFRNSTGLLKL